MNRIIKFRAWDMASEPKMLETVDYEYISTDGMEESASEVVFVDAENTVFLHRYTSNGTNEVESHFHAIPMQFTGKKDCNGVDIYDGDIIEFDRRQWGGDDNIHIVSWDDREAEWCWGGGITSDMCWRKVIGNIHETPELLPSACTTKIN